MPKSYSRGFDELQWHHSDREEGRERKGNETSQASAEAE
jgi:hypothetical protein